MIEMREALFIKKNRDKWIRYQQERTQDPDEQADRFITLLDDLAYSRTFYPQSKVTRWINSIAVNIYQHIYRNRKEKSSRLISFWTTELPLLVRKYHGVFLFTFVFFALCITMGVISSQHDELFVSSILGEDYVAMTEDNIRRGDPFGVYRDEDKFTMFIRIAANNIRVALRAFVFGVFFGLGTLYILFHNGIMVGAFEYLFFSKGLGWQSVMVIWIHGTIEISAVVVAGAAGFIVGRSLLFPGTYSRYRSFRTGIRDALKIAVALIPFFIAAALLESYVTYLMSNTFGGKAAAGLPVWAGALILLASCALIAWYFVWYPVKVHQKLQRRAAASLPPAPPAIQWVS